MCDLIDKLILKHLWLMSQYFIFELKQCELETNLKRAPKKLLKKEK